MGYVEVSKEAVVETLGTGVELIVCDFKSLRMCSCSDLTLSAVNAFLAKSESKFFKAVADE